MSSVKVPVSRPNASDPYAMMPMPFSWQYGKISRCMRRSNMFQPYWATSTRRTRMQASISSRLKFETPAKRALPSRTTSSRAPIVSSNGVSRSGQCTRYTSTQSVPRFLRLLSIEVMTRSRLLSRRFGMSR